MSMSIKDIEGIGPIYAERLASAGVHTTAQLLERASTSAERMRLADEARLGEDQVTLWSHQADLARVSGVGEEFSGLLVRAGITTVPKLAFRNPERLHTELVAYNAEHQLVRRLPSVSELGAMIAHAKTLPKIIRH